MGNLGYPLNLKRHERTNFLRFVLVLDFLLAFPISSWTLPLACSALPLIGYRLVLCFLWCLVLFGQGKTRFRLTPRFLRLGVLYPPDTSKRLCRWGDGQAVYQVLVLGRVFSSHPCPMQSPLWQL